MKIGVLGPLRVTKRDRTVDLWTGKSRVLLATLLLHAGERVSSERLVTEMWCGNPSPSAKVNLRMYVHQLRKALGPERITATHGGYALTASREEFDAWRFEDLVARARQTPDANQARYLFGQALDLWRGAAYGEFADTPSLWQEGTRLEELRQAVRIEYFDTALALGHHDQLIPELRSLVASHPLHEGFAARLMIALYRCGRPADALLAYRAVYRALTEQLGIDPAPELRAIEQAILARDPRLDHPTAQGRAMRAYALA